MLFGYEGGRGLGFVGEAGRSYVDAIIAAGQRLLVEIGKGQLDAVRELAERGGFEVEWVVADLAGIPRVVRLRA